MKIISTTFALCVVAAATTPAQAQYPYTPYTPYYNPYAGNMYGSAAVMNAQGQMMLDTQKAYMDKEKILQEKQKTRRSAINEYLYEQKVLPTREQQRQRYQQGQLQRSLNDPPLTEIWSGKALNDILLDLQRLSAYSSYSPSTPIDPDMLKHINFNTGMTSGSVGILGNLDSLTWPLALSTSEFNADHMQVDKLAKELVAQGKTNKIDPKTLRDLIDTVNRLKGGLRSKIATVSSTQYVAASRFLSELESATKVLQQPNVSNYFVAWKPRAQNVGELVNFMTGKGLRFAPATAGDESYYTALHRMLANYDIAMNRQVASASGFQRPPPGSNSRR